MGSPVLMALSIMILHLKETPKLLSGGGKIIFTYAMGYMVQSTRLNLLSSGEKKKKNYKMEDMTSA